MRAVLQRVRSASVSVKGRTVGEIGPGIAVLLGFGGSDDPDMVGGPVWNKFMQKLLGLRLGFGKGQRAGTGCSAHW